MSGGAHHWGVLAPAIQFRLLSGQRAFDEKTAASGAKRVLAFCGTCATSLWGGDATTSSVYSLRLGSARQRHALLNDVTEV